MLDMPGCARKEKQTTACSPDVCLNGGRIREIHIQLFNQWEETEKWMRKKITFILRDPNY